MVVKIINCRTWIVEECRRVKNCCTTGAIQQICNSSHKGCCSFVVVSLKEFVSADWASLVAQTINNLPAMQETWDWSLGREDPLEEGMPPTPSTLVWRIPWTEEPVGLRSVGSQRVGHDWVTKHNDNNNRFCKTLIGYFPSMKSDWELCALTDPFMYPSIVAIWL